MFVHVCIYVHTYTIYVHRFWQTCHSLSVTISIEKHTHLPAHTVSKELLTEVHSPDQLNEHAQRCFILLLLFIYFSLVFFAFAIYGCHILWAAVCFSQLLFVVVRYLSLGSTHVQTYHECGKHTLVCIWLHLAIWQSELFKFKTANRACKCFTWSCAAHFMHKSQVSVAVTICYYLRFSIWSLFNILVFFFFFSCRSCFWIYVHIYIKHFKQKSWLCS